MSSSPGSREEGPSPVVVDWLLEGDPAIRWQVMRDLLGAPAEEVAAERARVAREGWGAHLLARQREDGGWRDGGWRPTLYTLLLLRHLGVEPASPPARQAVERLDAGYTWGPEFGDSPFFEGEVEPCINGGTLALGGYFGEIRERLVERLLGEQLADGGWNCEAERGSVRSSFHSTICVLEGLLEVEKAAGPLPQITAARERAHEYLLERRLLRRLTTGEVIDPQWTRFSFPTYWHYDVLRALDYLRSAGVRPDGRMAEAVALVEERRDGSGRWPLENPHDNPVELEMEAAGEPSRWNTLRALRVLGWYSGSSAG